MGRLRRSRTHKAQRDVHRASRTRVNLVAAEVLTSYIFADENFPCLTGTYKRFGSDTTYRLRPEGLPQSNSVLSRYESLHRIGRSWRRKSWIMKSRASHNIIVWNAQSSFSTLCHRSAVNAGCASFRYFETDFALRSHWKSKVHKRRCKALKEPAYTIEESELAAGLGRDDRRAAAATSDDALSQSQ